MGDFLHSLRGLQQLIMAEVTAEATVAVVVDTAAVVEVVVASTVAEAEVVDVSCLGRQHPRPHRLPGY